LSNYQNQEKKVCRLSTQLSSEFGFFQLGLVIIQPFLC